MYMYLPIPQKMKLLAQTESLVEKDVFRLTSFLCSLLYSVYVQVDTGL